MEQIYRLSADQLELLLLETINEYQLLLLNGICEREARLLAVQQVRDAMAQIATDDTPHNQPGGQASFRVPK